MKVLRMMVVLGALSGLLSTPAWSYTEVSVPDGGTIRGRVSLVGGKPRPMAFNLVTIPDPVYCGRISTGTGWRIVEDFVTGPGNGLRDVVVMLKDITKGKPFELEPVRIDAIDCEFLPFVNVLKDRAKVTVVNMDPVEHDIQAYETNRTLGARVLFNRPLPMNHFHKLTNLIGANTHTHLPGKPMVEEVHLRKGRNIFVMQCGFHPYMFSWGVVVNNPYYDITGPKGVFELKNIPPGTYTLGVWHPGMKTWLERQVTVPAGRTVTEDFEYQAPTGRRSVHEMMENPHFGMEMLPEGEEIVPSLRVQTP